SITPPGVICVPPIRLESRIGRGFVCRLTVLRFSTITRRSAGRASMTRPCLPRSLPLIMWTRSPFLTFIFVDIQSTSGARETIFMKFLSRSSRATGPKIRVPRGLFALSMITAAFSSNAIDVPSSRPYGLRVRTTTAWTTSPFLIAPCGVAVFTVAVITSPTRPWRRFEPPFTRMQRISRAPVLSATRSRDSCWITGRLPWSSCPPVKGRSGKDAGRVRSWKLRTRLRTQPERALQRHAGCETRERGPSLLRNLHDLGKPPVLRLRERARLDDPNDVADLRLVLLVVGVKLRGAPDDLLVLRVRLHGIDPDDDRLVHVAGDHGATAFLAAAARMLGLGHTSDRLALGRPFALRLRVAVTLRAR